jgi:aminoglycoside 6'-N-acetyltransferase I
MANILVNPATSGDLESVVALATCFYGEEGFDTPAEDLRDHAASLIASPAALVLLAVADDQPAGFAITTTSYGLEHGLIAELEDLYILAHARGRGLARRLMDQSRAWATASGCSELEVVVDPEGEARHGLVGFYARLGFEDHGRRILSQELAPPTNSPAGRSMSDCSTSEIPRPRLAVPTRGREIGAEPSREERQCPGASSSPTKH